MIGVDAAAKAPADGYVCHRRQQLCANHTLVKNLPYDTLRDLRPVGLMGMSEHVLAVHPAAVAYGGRPCRCGEKSPGKLTYASFGNGTSAHLSGAMLEHALGVQLTHVPYKGRRRPSTICSAGK